MAEQEEAEERRDFNLEAAKFGGNYLHVKDESCPPYSPFYLMISGHIQSGTMNNKDGVCCIFDF